MLDLGPDRPRRRANLTPMIDVVFLLLVFFMLVSRFGVDRVLPLALPGAAGPAPVWSGPPRLVEVGPGGLALNGVPVAPEALAAALAPLVQRPDDPIVLRARDGASLQVLVAAMERLQAAGHTRLVLVPGGPDAP
ncbi:MAG: ExbD/TolR family protein [Gemmobacter sp.]|uniref:ExbD/TolR family protein n=1 Tax=Gemmobacter sp. TaxID=1898957 RepID=UPI00391B98B8